MSVRIGIAKNKIVKTVFSTYPNNIMKVSEILNTYYKKDSEIEELINLGDIYELNNNIQLTKFFNRDKGDYEEACKYFIDNVENLKDINTFNSPVDYYIIWNKKWYICEAYTKNWITLNKFLKQK